MDHWFASLGASLGVLAGCAGGPSADEAAPGTSASALEYTNALNANALNANALYPNALNANALNANALNANSLSQGALSALEDPGPGGDLSRQLLRYTVGCALDSTQSLSFSWTDAVSVVHNETYWGEIGLATNWSHQSHLPTSGEHWISACLASRVNWYGVPVTISSRGSDKALKKEGTPEMTTYAMQEGAFFGNLFVNPPRLYACHYAPNDAYSRAEMRACATGYVGADGASHDCGIIHVVGACAASCGQLNGNGLFYPTCTSNDGNPTWSHVVTVFLD